jgi:hypothetical protein
MRPGLPIEKMEEPDDLAIGYTVGPNINRRRRKNVQATAETSECFKSRTTLPPHPKPLYLEFLQQKIVLCRLDHWSIKNFWFK